MEKNCNSQVSVVTVSGRVDKFVKNWLIFDRVIKKIKVDVFFWDTV